MYTGTVQYITNFSRKLKIITGTVISQKSSIKTGRKNLLIAGPPSQNVQAGYIMSRNWEVLLKLNTGNVFFKYVLTYTGIKI
jgi:hypothetical protein